MGWFVKTSVAIRKPTRKEADKIADKNIPQLLLHAKKNFWKIDQDADATSGEYFRSKME